MVASSSASYPMPPWLLALIVLVVCSAIGVYYLNPKLLSEGFFSVRTDAAACERDRTSCIEDGSDNATCTSIYNDCTKDAALANKNVSTTKNAPGDPTQTATSSSAAQIYAKTKDATGDLGTGDKTLQNEYNSRRDSTLTGTTVKSSDAYKKLLTSLSERATLYARDGADKPSDLQLSLAQGDDTGYSGVESANYKPHQEIIKAHMTPTELKAAIQAKVTADKGTQAQAIQDASIMTASVRDMIRTDVKKATRDAMNEINNEYEIKYDN
jgi:hypothetical protein